MAKKKKIKQLCFEMKNKPGQLEQVSSALSNAKINIKAICAYGMGRKAYFMLVTTNNTKAKRVLARLKVKAREEDVTAVEMPNRVGQLKSTAAKIAGAGIDIQYMYGTVGTGGTAVCIFKTSNDAKALRSL